MSALADRIAQEHPNYATGSMIDGAECSTCHAPIEAMDGRVDLGWNRHIVEVTEAAVRESLAGQYDELAAEAHHDLRNPRLRYRAESIAGRAVAYETAARIARDGAA